MPPSSILSSMRYLPASTCPTSRSPLPARLRTAPSAGHSVVVSAYCLPHVGQVFIEEKVPPNFRCQGRPERITPLSRGAMRTCPSVLYTPNAAWIPVRPRRRGRALRLLAFARPALLNCGHGRRAARGERVEAVPHLRAAGRPSEGDADPGPPQAPSRVLGLEGGEFRGRGGDDDRHHRAERLREVHAVADH